SATFWSVSRLHPVAFFAAPDATAPPLCVAQAARTMPASTIEQAVTVTLAVSLLIYASPLLNSSRRLYADFPIRVRRGGIPAASRHNKLRHAPHAFPFTTHRLRHVRVHG